MLELSAGQRLALHQLGEIAARSDGALEIVDGPVEGPDAKYISVSLSLATRHYRRPAGLALRDRERLKLFLHPDFPFRLPWLHFGHSRHLGAPHVQWGRHLCLYQAPETEWNPGDGLFGFFERVEQWMAAAGKGQLDPDDAPLHPPVAYPKSATRFVIRTDAPATAADDYWLGCANLERIHASRLDLTGWTAFADWDVSSDAPTAAAILFNAPLPMEYPSKINDLIKVFEGAGLGFAILYQLLRLNALITPVGEPGYFVLGAPMRRKAAGEPLRQHLTVWEIEATALETLREIIRAKGEDELALTDLATWMVTAEVRWCRVLEDRPEIVQRRDTGSLAEGLAGKRVLILGCGALGSAIAETVVRAGASALGLADEALVRPGLLVRQRYADADIGRLKVMALSERIAAIGLPCALKVEIGDLAEAALSRFTLTDWDLIIDATASRPVSNRIEQELVDFEGIPPMLSVSVSAAARYGLVMVRQPGFRGGPRQISRQGKLEAFARDAGHPMIRAFWPERGEIEIFQPEPGCSEPTFTGSAADIDYYAAALFNIGLDRLRTLGEDRASLDLIRAPWQASSGREAPCLRYDFTAYPAFVEQRHDYVVLQSENARRGMAAEMRRISRTRSDKIETGGLMFGEIDDSHRQIWIDSVSGPPPDSEASAERFLCGTSGTAQLANFRARATGNSSRFIGIWHTHPVSLGRPSTDDLVAMHKLLHGQHPAPRQVVMLIIGLAATRPTFNHYLYHRDEFRLIASEDVGKEGDV